MRPLILAALALAMLAACAAPRSTATYRVDGPPQSEALVRYAQPGGEERQERVTLPWTLEVAYSPGQRLSVTADGTSRAGDVSCAITLAGRAEPAAQQRGADQAACEVAP